MSKANALALKATSPTLTMSSREIAELVESRHDDVKRSIERLAGKNIIGLPPLAEYLDSLGRAAKEYHLNKRESLIVVAQLCPEFTAAVIDRWQKLEAQQGKGHFVVPQNLPEALRLAAYLAEQKALVELERDEAIATKAEIGRRREATAMNTASQAIKKAARLEIELDKSKQYATIKRMELLYHGQQFKWQLLKSTANEMGIAPIDVFDANYGTVKAYHADVWRKAYALSIGHAGAETNNE